MDNQTEQLTHYKKLRDPNYFGAYEMIYNEDAEGKALWSEKVVTIIKVVREKTKTQKSDEELVVYFAEAKPLILNGVNSERIAKVCESEMIEKWVGKQLTMYVEYIHNRMVKKWQYVARVRPEAPQKKQNELTPNHPRWTGAKLSLSKGDCTLEQIKKAFVLSPENEKLLVNG